MIQYLRTMPEELASTEPSRSEVTMGGLETFPRVNHPRRPSNPSRFTTVTRESHTEKRDFS